MVASVRKTPMRGTRPLVLFGGSMKFAVTPGGEAKMPGGATVVVVMADITNRSEAAHEHKNKAQRRD